MIKTRMVVSRAKRSVLARKTTITRKQNTKPKAEATVKTVSRRNASSKKKTQKKNAKLVRCCFTKDDGGYYGTKFFEESVTGTTVKVDTGQSKWPYKYPDGIVTWKIINHSKDEPIEKIFIKAISLAISAIGIRVKNIRFKQEKDNTKSTDIEIHFSHDDQTFIDRPNVLAYAYLVTKKPEEQPESKKIVFNDRHFWSVYGGTVSADLVDPIHYKKGTKVRLKAEPLIQIFMHEFIHKLGLRHDVKEKNSLMWPFSKDPNHPYAFNLHPRDIARLQNKYGKRIVSESVIRSFRYIRGRF